MTAFDPTQDAGFLAALQAAFQVEAGEHLQALSAGLLALEKTPAPARPPLLEAIRREAHSLKGAARAVNRADLEALGQRLEQVLADWKRGETPGEAGGFDALHHLLDDAALLLPGGPAPAAPQAAAGRMAMPETVRVATAKLDRLMLQAEEMLAAKLAAGQRTADLQALVLTLDEWKNAWSSLRPDAQGAAGSLLGGFLDWSQSWVKALERQVRTLAEAAAQDHRAIGQAVDTLRKDAKELLMTPMAQLLAPLGKLVHDLCRDEGKEAELVVRGEEVEIDKRILEEMKDPLIHLLRNCVDHGIEKPGQREQAGKPRQGTITVAIRQVEGNRVEILVADDGGGIDLAGLKDAAVRKGILTAARAAQLTEGETYPLLFESGVSTRKAVTSLSGRGLGMAIVREKCDKLNGRISVQSQRGRGAEFLILLPLTLATFRGLLVKASDQIFALPLAPVTRVDRVRRHELGGRESRATMNHQGEPLPIVPLAALLGLPARPDERSDFIPVVVMAAAGHRVAFAVDAVLHEEEVLVKIIRGPVGRLRYIVGAAVLGSGLVVPVLQPVQLVKTALIWQPEAAAPAPVPPAASILVAEDSITSRLLLKGLLESAGYRVRTAVDGMEAWQLLAGELFSAVVSDVEMPRLNGFELVAQMRAAERTARVPVVLVTALANASDRDRGQAAGANAYLVKGQFEHSDLLETLRRLLP